MSITIRMREPSTVSHDDDIDRRLVKVFFDAFAVAAQGLHVMTYDDLVGMDQEYRAMVAGIKAVRLELK